MVDLAISSIELPEDVRAEFDAMHDYALVVRRLFVTKRITADDFDACRELYERHGLQALVSMLDSSDAVQ